MRLEWDEKKRQTNLDKHGLDFVDAARIFNELTLTVEDDRYDYGEQRWYTIGTLDWRIVVFVYTEHDDVIRCISLRKATRYEQESYFAQIPDRLGPS